MSSRRQERIDKLRDALASREVLRLKEAATLLGVSEMTVRRDIAACDGCLTYLGGYILPPPETAGGMGYILDRERESHSDLKRAAGAAAAALVAPRETIFVDCGTTTPHLAAALPDDQGLTVVCYAMNVAEIVCKKPGIRVIVLGGLYHPSSASFSGAESLTLLKGLAINKAFISAGGVHETRGVSCSNFHEIAIKQTAMANAETKVLVVDSTKFGTVKPMLFGRLDEFDIVACDGFAESAATEMVAKAGGRLTTA